MQHVVFLRGVNVGGRAIHMSELRDCFSDMGFDNVTTVLQSGNVIFRSDLVPRELKRTIEARLHKRFDYPAHVHIIEMARLRQIVEASPYDDNGAQMHSYVIFFEDGLERELVIEAKDVIGGVESIELGEGVIYWHVPKGSTLHSGFAKYLTKARYRDFHTNRNINTLRKILNQ